MKKQPKKKKLAVYQICWDGQSSYIMRLKLPYHYHDGEDFFSTFKSARRRLMVYCQLYIETWTRTLKEVSELTEGDSHV